MTNDLSKDLTIIKFFMTVWFHFVSNRSRIIQVSGPDESCNSTIERFLFTNEL